MTSMTTEIMSAIALASLLLCANMSAANENLTLFCPGDYQVVQRQTAAAGALHVQGRTTVSAEQWQYRLLGRTEEAWHDFPSPVREGNFDFTIKAPAGGWYRLQVRGLNAGQTVAEAAVAHVGIGEVFIIAGQSNAANHGSERQTPKTGKVSSFNGAQWTLANDPQPGASGDGGSFLPAFGDALNERLHVPIGIVNIAQGSTSVREWLPKGERMQQEPSTGANVTKVGPGEWECTGVIFNLFAQRFAALGLHGFRAVLWHQGESDAGQARAGYPAEVQITGEQYFEFMRTLIRASQKQAGWRVPWITAQTTYHGEEDASDAEFRAAMKKLWDQKLSWQGPDTDTLRAEYRDGVHFNAKGLQKHGLMWADKVSAWLEKKIGPK